MTTRLLFAVSGGGTSTTARSLFVVSERGVIVFLPEPRECACGRAAMVIINRCGRSRCVACDTEDEA